MQHVARFVYLVDRGLISTQDARSRLAKLYSNSGISTEDYADALFLLDEIDGQRVAA